MRLVLILFQRGNLFDKLLIPVPFSERERRSRREKQEGFVAAAAAALEESDRITHVTQLDRPELPCESFRQAVD